MFIVTTSGETSRWSTIVARWSETARENADDKEVAWPPTRAQRELLVALAAMIRRFGAERFLEAPLVRADTHDVPDRWEPRLHTVHQLLYRLCWHAHIDPEIAVVDTLPLLRGRTTRTRSSTAGARSHAFASARCMGLLVAEF